MNSNKKHLQTVGALVGAICIATLVGCSDGSSPPFAVQSVSPAAEGELIPVDTQVAITFNRSLDSTTFSAAEVRLECDESEVTFADVSFQNNARTVFLTPDTLLPENKDCEVQIAAEVKDVSNNTLGKVFGWTFGTTARPETLALGKEIFRYDTFGDERFWTDVLEMHDVIQSAVDPVTALSVGLKVDAEALPEAVVNGIAQGTINLESPATTVALLKLDAVVGVKGTVEEVNGVDTLTSVGVTCALCHSTVDNSFAPGIGKRLDGWANRDLNPGAIIALSPALTPAQKDIYNSWGPGMYDARFNQDGISSPHVITPAFGLNGIEKTTSTGDGNDIAYWNRYVAVTQMGGEGSFYEPRTGVDVTNGTEDLVTDKLPALQAYQLSLLSPEPPEGSFDPTAAARGEELFNGQAQCSSCHSGPKFTDANSRLHDPSDVVSEPEPDGAPGYASRSATKMYRTAPLEGIWQHPPYFHNGMAATLADVVTLYNDRKALGLDEDQQSDLVEYLKSL
ncbi:Ig-like domain-containing protein [Marinobacter salarius]|uniref:Ig-like domain-containing protein n=1 Tax=Marinobacter salarius TaxID=1420917 RepID=UPI003BAA412D|tara:strand:- start:5804 stop:7330 length:1527 start_codon:yes stop_codon:yes gene_type:complete